MTFDGNYPTRSQPDHSVFLDTGDVHFSFYVTNVNIPLKFIHKRERHCVGVSTDIQFYLENCSPWMSSFFSADKNVKWQGCKLKEFKTAKGK